MFATETVARLRAGVVTDPYSGDTSLAWELGDGQSWATEPTETDLTTLAPAEPRPTSEPVENARNAVVDGWTLYLPEDSDVTARDRMRVRGDVFDVLGTPASWLGAGLVVQCGRKEG